MWSPNQTTMWSPDQATVGLHSPRRTDIKRIIEALGRQAIELQQQRGLLIHLIHADPSYMESILRIPEEVRYMTPPDPRVYHFSESVNHLMQKVHRIESSLARIKEKTTELHLLIPPIESLPVPTLVAIFQAGSLSEPKGDLPFPMLIASVSRRWRDIAIKTPSIWTNLHIALGRPLYWPALALQRSSDHLLDITLDFRNYRPPSADTVTYFMSLLTPHVDRWRRFDLITHHSDVVLAVCGALVKEHSSTLQHLRLSLTGAGPSGEQEVTIPRILKGGTPALHSVRFDSVALPWLNPPLAGLTTLDIRWLWSSKLAYSEFRELLSASPTLTNLILRGKHVDLRPRMRYPPINLPSLRYLEVSGDNMSTMCSLLVPSALETLTLANVDESEFRDFISLLPFHDRRYASLESLVLLNVATSSLSPEITSAFPTITQLTIINSGADQFLELLCPKRTEARHPDALVVWPNLKYITLLDVTSYDKLYRMVTERSARGAPLKRLIVHTEFIHRNLLGPLEQYVKVDSITHLDREP